jgi:ureidoglycolate hydrolase
MKRDAGVASLFGGFGFVLEAYIDSLEIHPFSSLG